MKLKLKLPNRKQVTQVASEIVEKGAVLLILVYIIFSVGRSVMKNYTMNQKISDLEQEIAALDREKDYLANIIVYYRTDTFKELKAREELGLQKPGEHVLSVPVEEDDKPLGEADSFIAAENAEPEKPLPNYEKWRNYFFQ